jgi:hypothetical protein
METRKRAIVGALRAFMNQRSGIEFGSYGDVKAFRAEQRSITKDLHQARELMRAVELSDSITADNLIRASEGAFSGRLCITETNGGAITIDYVTGQYFPTEYRRAVCAVLASALWEYARKECMPSPLTTGEHTTYLWHPAGQKSPDAKSAGEWLRAHFRQQFGRGIASRWFS